MSRSRAVVVLCAVMAVTAPLVAGCGVPSDSTADPINPDDLPFGLSATTTSTTLVVTSTEPHDGGGSGVPVTNSPVTPPGDTGVVAVSTTIATEQVSVYYVAGSRLVPVALSLPTGASLEQVVAALDGGLPSGPAGVGLRTLLPAGSLNNVTLRNGVAMVDLDGSKFDAVAPEDQRRAIGQLVLTLTNRPGVGQVSLSVDGEALAAPKAGNVVGEPGEPVSADDYSELLSAAPLPTTPTTLVAVTEPDERDTPR